VSSFSSKTLPENFNPPSPISQTDTLDHAKSTGEAQKTQADG